MADPAAGPIGQNERIFRDANQAIRKSAERYGVIDRVPFVCECADRACTAVVRLSLAEYDAICRDSSLILNAPGHVSAAGASARVEERRATYDVVRKLGVSEAARELDPRPEVLE